jgi:hypothetical protein
MRGVIGTLGRLVMVAVAAILIGGSLAAPAVAATRDDGVQQANEFILACVDEDGDPEVIEAGDEIITVSCRFSEGHSMDCIWGSATDWAPDCAIIPSRLVPGGGLPTVDPNDLHTLEPVEDAPVRPPGRGSTG